MIFFAFLHQVFDGQAGLHQNNLRDYDPAVGRYVESDPIGLDGGGNTYAYAGGDPADSDDPLGLYIARIPYSSESYKGTGAYVCQYYRTNATAGPWGAARRWFGRFRSFLTRPRLRPGKTSRGESPLL